MDRTEVLAEIARLQRQYFHSLFAEHSQEQTSKILMEISRLQLSMTSMNEQRRDADQNRTTNATEKI